MEELPAARESAVGPGGEGLNAAGRWRGHSRDHAGASGGGRINGRGRGHARGKGRQDEGMAPVRGFEEPAIKALMRCYVAVMDSLGSFI